MTHFILRIRVAAAAFLQIPTQVSANWRAQSRVQAICDFVHDHLRFDYLKARADRTALDGFRERVGVCRDFTHLAITAA